MMPGGLDNSPQHVVWLRLLLHLLHLLDFLALAEVTVGQVTAHEHRCVAVVGLPRDIGARPCACGHDARPCIRAATRERSGSRPDCSGTLLRLAVTRPAGGPPGRGPAPLGSRPTSASEFQEDDQAW